MATFRTASTSAAPASALRARSSMSPTTASRWTSPALGRPSFTDVYWGISDLPYVNNFRAGHYKESFSLEELTSSNYITFMERSLPNAFAPARNWGVSTFDYFEGEWGTWALGAFRPGTDDFGDDIGDSGEWAATGRLTATPVVRRTVRRPLPAAHRRRRQLPRSGFAQPGPWKWRGAVSPTRRKSACGKTASRQRAGICRYRHHPGQRLPALRRGSGVGVWPLERAGGVHHVERQSDCGRQATWNSTARTSTPVTS